MKRKQPEEKQRHCPPPDHWLVDAICAAEIIGCSKQRLYTRVRKGELPRGVIVRLGARLLFNRAKLMEFLQAGGTPDDVAATLAHREPHGTSAGAAR